MPAMITRLILAAVFCSITIVLAAPYTMLVCDEANSCNDYCTTKTMNRHDWHVAQCSTWNSPHNTNCDGKERHNLKKHASLTRAPFP